MTILKSKAFWGFASVSSCVGGAVAFDRYEAKKVRDELLCAARVFGSEPLYAHQSTRLLSFVLISPGAEHRRACIAALKDYALDILTAGGVDYKWTVLVDGEEAKGDWDGVGREANQPELMVEEGKQAISVDELAEIILRPILNNDDVNQNESNVCRKALREKYAAVPITDEIVCFDQNTLNSIKSELDRIKTENDIFPVIEQPVKRSWWWQRRHTPSKPLESLKLDPEKVNLYFVPCELDQSAFARLRRFLFGQRHLTRDIGGSVLKILSENTKQLQ